MDEKIKEIMSKCYVPVIERDGDNEYDMEKFAGLIIEECCREMVDTDSFYGGSMSQVIKEHFGID